MPFTRPQTLGNKLSNENAKDKRTTETIQQASLISNQYKSLSEIDIKTAEAIAKMINAGKIFSDLLVYLTSPNTSVKGAISSTQTPKAEAKGLQPRKRPTAATSKRSKSKSSANAVQEPRSVFKSELVVSKPENDPAGVKGLTDCTPESTLAVKKSLPDEHPTAVKVSKANNQGRKQVVDKRAKNKDTFAVIAYPTQRPARQKRTKKNVIARNNLPKEKLRQESCDTEALVTHLPPQELSDNNYHKENTPGPQSIPENMSRKICSSPESSWEEHEEFNTTMAEEALEPEQAAADNEYYPCDIYQNEDLVTPTYKPSALSLPKGLIPQYGSGVRGLLWSHTVNTDIDEILDDAGVWLWMKPSTYFCPQHLLQTERFGHPALAPVIVSHERTGNDEPIVEFDGVTVHIVPHEQCWEDVRSHESHPDFMVPWKLAEYQACEAVGYQIWRHDRDHQKCRKTGCDIMVSDYHHTTVLCLGCGPKSVVRYCSLYHQFEGVEEHWRECGTQRVSLERVVDHTTAPSKFAEMYPAIKRRHGSETAALYRQMLHCTLNNGHYTLFDRRSAGFDTLCWPKQDPKWLEMDRRIERLLNIAFFDGWNHYVLDYLYRLLRESLRSRGEWSESMAWSFKLQFESEFSDYRAGAKWRNGDAPCQCEWSGKTWPRWDHLSSCWAYSPRADGEEPVRRGEGMEATVRKYEASFWILRAWRQQHPTQHNWRLRAAGYDFPDTRVDEGCYKLGPGWTGWGGENDNICEDQGDQNDIHGVRPA